MFLFNKGQGKKWVSRAHPAHLAPKLPCTPFQFSSELNPNVPCEINYVYLNAVNMLLSDKNHEKLTFFVTR